MSVGYCCINLGINKSKKRRDNITPNRGMVKKTFETKGLSYVSELTILNLLDLKKILEWNVEMNISVYRMSSDMFPCIGFYKLEDLPNFDKICKLLSDLGDFAKKSKIRLSFHPSHFCVLGSTNPDVVEKTIDELDKHAKIMDLMGLDKSNFNPINIHLNITQPTHEEAANRFCENFKMLGESTKKRLTIENDDKPGQYSVKMLYDLVYKKIGIPIVVDSLHYMCHPNGMTWEETLLLGVSTWKEKPLVHHSSSKKIYEDSSVMQSAHADFIYEKFNDLGLDLDIELECKQKDIATLRYIQEFHQLVR